MAVVPNSALDWLTPMYLIFFFVGALGEGLETGGREVVVAVPGLAWKLVDVVEQVLSYSQTLAVICSNEFTSTKISNTTYID